MQPHNAAIYPDALAAGNTLARACTRNWARGGAGKRTFAGCKFFESGLLPYRTRGGGSGGLISMEVSGELVGIQLALGSIPGPSAVEARGTNVPATASQNVVSPLHFRATMPTYQEDRLRELPKSVAHFESGAFDSQRSFA